MAASTSVRRWRESKAGAVRALSVACIGRYPLRHIEHLTPRRRWSRSGRARSAPPLGFVMYTENVQVTGTLRWLGHGDSKKQAKKSPTSLPGIFQGQKRSAIGAD